MIHEVQTSSLKIGWFCLGSIGTRTARRVLSAGQPARCRAPRGKGLRVADLYDGYVVIASDCDVLGVCVFNHDQREQALLASGALSAMSSGWVRVVDTTGSPKLARYLADHAPNDVEVLHASFNGGPAEVANRALAL